jgi:LmbE family N-acetylglucosaminyl deacetylase
MKRVLAFGCHPDDIEFMAGGTLALLAERGYEIHLATMTGGEVGSPTLSREAIHAKRLAEAAASAKVLDGVYHYAGGCDLEVEYNSFYRQASTRIVREVDPEIVLTHPPSDYMVDHEITSRLVQNGAYIAPVPLYDCGTQAPPTRKAPYLYYWNAVGLKDIFGRALPMQFGIDVTSVMDIKETMVACHASQREWLAAMGFDHYLKLMKDWTLAQGALIGRQYAECFIQHLGAGFPAENRLAEALGTHAAALSDLCNKAGQ